MLLNQKWGCLLANITIKKDVETNAKIDVACGVCKRSTKHKILSDIHLSGRKDISEYEFYDWNNEYQIIQCQGCEAVAFRQTHENSEDYYQVSHDEIEYAKSIDVYPNPEGGRQPLDDEYLLPSNLNRIYSETIKSLNSNHSVLTGIGIRAVVETICKDKNSRGRDLFAKINDLVTQGVLTQDGADILHKLRSLGNQAAHEVKPHDNVQLGLAMDVIDHLIQGVYILPHHAKFKFK